MNKIKTLPLFFIILLCGVLVNAQEKNTHKFKMGVGVTLAVPTYNLEYTSIGGGLDLAGLYQLSPSITLTADAGYVGLKGKYSIPFTGIVPVRAGLRIYPVENFYIGGKIGLAFYTLGNVSERYATYSLGAGAAINTKWDLGISYDGYSHNGSFGYMAIRAGYYFVK